MSAVDQGRRARREYDLVERLDARVAEARQAFDAAGWETIVQVVDDVEDRDLVRVLALGAVLDRDGEPALDAVLAFGVSRRTGRVSVLCDPDRHNARLVVYENGTRRYWHSPLAGAWRDLIADPARWIGAES